MHTEEYLLQRHLQLREWARGSSNSKTWLRLFSPYQMFHNELIPIRVRYTSLMTHMVCWRKVISEWRAKMTCKESLRRVAKMSSLLEQDWVMLALKNWIFIPKATTRIIGWIPRLGCMILDKQTRNFHRETFYHMKWSLTQAKLRIFITTIHLMRGRSTGSRRAWSPFLSRRMLKLCTWNIYICLNL